MRDAKPQVHPNDALSAEFGATMAPQFPQPIKKVVEHHESQGQRNDQQVEAANPLNDRMRRSSGNSHMYGADGQFFADTLVALAAGLAQVRGIDGRARIAGAQNRVNAVAGGAVGRGERTFPHGQAVKTVGVGGEAVRRQVIEPGQASIRMAAPASLRGDVCRI